MKDATRVKGAAAAIAAAVAAGLCLVACPGTARAQESEFKQLMDRAEAAGRANDFRKGMEYARKALAIVEKVVGPEDQVVGDVNAIIGTYAAQVKDFRTAESSLKRSLAISERNNADTAKRVNVMTNLAGMYVEMQQFTQAEEMFKGVIALSENRPGMGLPLALVGLGSIYTRMNRLEEAEPLLRRSTLLLDEKEEANCRTLASTYHALGYIAYRRGRPDTAAAMYRRSLQLGERVMPPDDPSLAATLNNLATIHADREDYAGAEPLLARALAILEKHNGADDPDVVSMRSNLIIVYRNLGRTAEAEALEKRSTKAGSMTRPAKARPAKTGSTKTRSR